VLPVVVLIAMILAILGFGLLTLAQQEIILNRIECDKTQAFYLAEAGLAKLSENLLGDDTGVLEDGVEEQMEQGRYYVEFDTNDSNSYAVSTGVSGNVHKKIRVKVNYLAASFEDAVFATNKSGGNWAFALRGKNNPILSGGREIGGRDIVNGNIFVDGDVRLYEESSINPAPAPNIWNLDGDASATGGISVLDSASISGDKNQNAGKPKGVDLTAMNYATENTHDVAKIFHDAGVTKGTLPKGNELRDIFAINPADRKTECGTTAGDDYFLEPVSITGGGTQKDAPTPLNVGENRIFYIDGDLWVHSISTYGFTMNGKVTIVVTGNIHICDNIKYANTDSVLGLVALGKYNSSGQLISGGNIYFGDPVFGTTYTVSGLMFAANDFLYNTSTTTGKPAEPTTGFTVNGSFAAMNQVLIERDWYIKNSVARPAKYDNNTGGWVDSETGATLTLTEFNSLRHYQMIVNYDARVRSQQTQPPGLPQGGSGIFAGLSNWEEL